MKKKIVTKDIDERNRLIEELYKAGKTYLYTGPNSSGEYTVAYEDDTKILEETTRRSEE